MTKLQKHSSPKHCIQNMRIIPARRAKKQVRVSTSADLDGAKIRQKESAY